MKQLISRIGVACLAACLLCGPAASQAAEKGQMASPALADVNGVKLTRAEFEAKFAGKLFQARNAHHDAERKVLEEYIEQQLLEQQAKKEGLTVEQLLDKHVNSKIAKDPSEEALRVYYEGVDTKETFEAVRPKIIEALRERRKSKIKTTYMAELKQNAKIFLMLAPPRANMSMKDAPVRGVPNAPVTLLEYADYECPYCVQVAPEVKKLEEEYKGKIAVAFKDVPLPMHANAPKAAEATHCAGAQNKDKYWEFHDVLLSKKPLDVDSLKKYARDLKLDGAAFDKCLDSGMMAARVKKDLDEAQSLGLQGTPSFFVNGRAVSNPTYEMLKQVIEEELSAATMARR